MTRRRKGALEMLSHTRRLSPEEIQVNLPKILGVQRQKDEAQAVRKAVVAHKQSAEERKVGTSMGDSLRRAYKKGLRVRGPKGHFLGLPKA